MPQTANTIVDSMSTSVGQLVTIGIMLAALGYFIKKWINGTASDIVRLKEGKIDIVRCDDKREACRICFANIQADLAVIHAKLEELNVSLPILTSNQATLIALLQKLANPIVVVPAVQSLPATIQQ